MGTHNGSENGRGARVALCAHPTHIDTDKFFNKTVLTEATNYHKRKSKWMRWPSPV
jgi:hypothetical protein